MDGFGRWTEIVILRLMSGRICNDGPPPDSSPVHPPHERNRTLDQDYNLSADERTDFFYHGPWIVHLMAGFGRFRGGRTD